MNAMGFFNDYRKFSKDIYIIAMCKFVIAVGNFIIPFLSLFLITKQHIGVGTAGAFITGISLAYLPATIIGGKMASAKNQKRLLISFFIISSLSYFFVAFCNLVIIQLTLILIGKILLTLTEPMLSVIINNSCSQGTKKQAFSLLYFAMNLGFALGPLIAGALFQNHTDLIFILDAASKAVVACLIAAFVSEPSNVISSKSARSVHHTPSRYYSNIFIFCFVMALYGFFYSNGSFLLPLFLNQTFHSHGVQYYAYVMTVNALCVIFLTSVITSATKKMSSINCIWISGLFLASGFGLYYFTFSLSLAIVSTVVWSVGEILWQTNLSVYISENSSPEQFAMTTSWVTVASRIGLFMNPMLIGYAIKYVPIKTVWLLTFAIMFGVSFVPKVINTYKNNGLFGF